MDDLKESSMQPIYSILEEQEESINIIDMPDPILLEFIDENQSRTVESLISKLALALG